MVNSPWIAQLALFWVVGCDSLCALPTANLTIMGLCVFSERIPLKLSRISLMSGVGIDSWAGGECRGGSGRDAFVRARKKFISDQLQRHMLPCSLKKNSPCVVTDGAETYSGTMTNASFMGKRPGL